MLVTVDEAKLYLRLDGTEEDALIQTLLETAESLCQDIVRTDFDEMEEVSEIVKVGICYDVTYLYENREKGNYLKMRDEITTRLLDADITITSRKYMEFEKETKYHHYIFEVMGISE